MHHLIKLLFYISAASIIQFDLVYGQSGKSPNEIVAALEKNLCADPKLNQSSTEGEAACVDCLAQSEKSGAKVEAENIQSSLEKKKQEETELAFYKLMDWNGANSGAYGSQTIDSLQSKLNYYKEQVKNSENALASAQEKVEIDKSLQNGSAISPAKKSRALEHANNYFNQIKNDYELVLSNDSYAHYRPKYQAYVTKLMALKSWLVNPHTTKAPYTFSQIAEAHPHGWGSIPAQDVQASKKQVDEFKYQVAKIEDQIKEFKPTSNVSGSNSEWKKYDDQYSGIMQNMAKSARRCGMSNAELYAIRSYTGNGYRGLNKALRAGGEQAKRYEPYRAVLNSALAKLAPYKGEVNRGGDLPPSVLELYREGEIVDSPAFTSTSVGHGFGANHRFVIKSKTGAYVGSYSSHYSEQEVLIPAGAKFKVLERKNRAGGAIDFVLEEVE